MSSWRLPEALVARVYASARADRWAVPLAGFTEALERSAQKAFAAPPDAQALERYLSSLHLEELALACACAAGHEDAWDHFVREHRPALYRAADAIDPSGGSRELADSLYAELFGLVERDGERRSLFVYYHGRSSLTTWLRAILAQRHVDRIRSTRRLEPLPAEDGDTAAPPAAAPPRRDTSGYIATIRRAVKAAVDRLAPKDRLRLGYYYAHDLTLAQIGRALGEHEATVSRHLARARREIRADVEHQLRDDEHMSPAQIEDCFASVVDDVGALDVTDLLGAVPGQDQGGSDAGRKDGPGRRSKERTEGASA